MSKQQNHTTAVFVHITILTFLTLVKSNEGIVVV